MSDWPGMLTADVLTLGMAADEKRRVRANGSVVTYLRVHVVSAGDIAAQTPVPAAAQEVRLHDLPPTLDEAVDQVRRLATLAGPRRVAAFSAADLEERGWLNAHEAMKALVAAGMHDVAELPVDRLDELSGTIDALGAAGIAPRRLTVERPMADRKVEIIQRVQAAIARHPSIRYFSPLPRRAPADKPTTGYDDVRMVALSRLALDAASIEVDWILYGPKLAQVALTFGADHLDAVPAIDDVSLGRRRATIEDVERNIRAAGFEPRLVDDWQPGER